MIRHDVALELAAVALDFDLTADEHRELDAHLSVCPTCARTARGLRADTAALGALPPAMLDVARAEAIAARVLAPRRSFAIRPLRLALLAALVALLAIGSLLVGSELLRRAGPDDLSVVPPAPSGSLGPDASGLDNGVGAQWVRVDLPDASVPEPGGATMGGVIAGGPGAIAWGWAYGLAPRIWTTADGRTWERAAVEVPTDADPDILEPGTINDITAGGPGYVAVGFYTRDGTGRRGLVWTSTDGRSWDLVPHQSDLENAYIYRVVEWRGGLLAFGHWSIGPSGGATETIAWASDDGSTWTRLEVVLPDGLTLGPVVAAGERLWATPDELGDDTGMEWTDTLLVSEDGRTWERSDLPSHAGSLTEASGALISLVRPQSGDSPVPAEARIPGVYRATDGTTWQVMSSEPTVVGYDLIDVGPVLIMVGDDAAGDSECAADCQAMGWRSIDGGATWRPVPADVIGGTMTSVAAMPDGTLVSVGRLLAGQGWPSPAAWVSTRSVSPAASPTPAASASPSPSPVVPDLGADLVWERAPDQAALADAGMMAIAVGPDRYVAVGCATTSEVDASQCSGAAWVSTDGRSWTRGTVEAATGLYLGGVVAAPIGYLAWAYDIGAAFWFSSDGREWQRAATIPSFSYDFVGNVVWFGGRFVALSEGNVGASVEPHVWVSDDGLTWSDPTDTVGCDGGQQRYSASGVPGSNVIVMGNEIVTVGTEYTGAEGSEYLGPDAYRRVVARSSDGRCWTVERAPSGGWTNAVVGTDGGLVAVGRSHDPVGSDAGSPPSPMAAWVSPDGVSWVTASFGGEPPRGSLEFVASGDRGILAIGSTETGYSQWRSVDGATWSGSKRSLNELSDLAAIPGGFIAVGRDTLASGNVRAAVWIAR